MGGASGRSGEERNFGAGGGRPLYYLPTLKQSRHDGWLAISQDGASSGGLDSTNLLQAWANELPIPYLQCMPKGKE